MKTMLKDFLSKHLSAEFTSENLPENTNPAGVLVPLFIKNETWQVLLNKRSSQVADHKNEIAFPGGRLESSDSDIQACALREAHEEMGILPQDVSVLGQLDIVVTRTGYAVYPTVGVIPYPYKFKVSPNEVAEVLEVPIRELLDPLNFLHEARLTSNNELDKSVSFIHQDKLIYGATAKIISQLTQIISEALCSNTPIESEESIQI